MQKVRKIGKKEKERKVISVCEPATRMSCPNARDNLLVAITLTCVFAFFLSYGMVEEVAPPASSVRCN